MSDITRIKEAVEDIRLGFDAVTKYK